MNVEEFLSQGGTSLEAVLASVDGWLEMGPEDILLAAGSLAEGLGSSKSDLDLLLVSHRTRTELPEQDEVIWALGNCAVDVRILHHDRVANLLNHLKNWVKQPWDVSNVAKFNHDERVLLHRLRHAEVLKSGGGQHAVEAITPALPDLALLKLQVARHAAKTIQVDMVGYRESGDFATLGFAAQKLLGHAIDALLAGHHMTNPLSKWRCRYLDRLQEDWDRAMGMRPQPGTAIDAYWQRHRLPEHPAEDLALAHAHSIATFARTVFIWAEYRLVLGMDPPVCHPVGAEVSLPHLVLDADFFLTPTGAKVSRLNEFDADAEILDLTREELALLPLFEGPLGILPGSPVSRKSSRLGMDLKALFQRLEEGGLLAAVPDNFMTQMTILGG